MKKGQIRTKEKAKRVRRRSGWKHYIVLLVVLVGLFLSIGRYFGGQAEQALRQYLYTHSKIMGEKLVRIELLGYQKNVLGAEAELRLSSDIPVISEAMGEVNVKAKLINGPLFITKQGVSLGSSRWVFAVDEAHSTESEIENIRAFFPKQLPTIVVRTDFRHQAHYFSRLETNIAKLTLSGYYKFETKEREESNHGSIQVENLQLGVKPTTLHADNLSISYQQNGQAVSAGYKPGVMAIRSSLITFNHPYLKQAVSVSLVAKSDLAIEEALLKGFVQVDIQQMPQKKELPFDSAKVILTFNGLSADGVVALSDAKAELDNLRQQVDWTLEDMGAYPEGRDELIQLEDKIDSAQKKIGSTLFSKVFHGNDSLFKLEASAQKNKIKSTVAVILSAKTFDKLSQKELYSPTFKGEIIGRFTDEWQHFLATMVHKMGKDELITVNKVFKVDLDRSVRLFE